jgi:hypothetical protein
MLASFGDRTPYIVQALSRRRSLADMADILERHVSRCPARCTCAEARDALRRVGRQDANLYVRAALRVLEREERACVGIRKVIESLRKLGRVALR